jgi:DNA invertase Pin-like site-specific DNA recombinase
MADGLERRFLEGTIEAPEWGQAGQPSVQIGAAYLRFSCDNSNPRSLDQQLKNVLERAARDRVFIPWNFVLADAAVSGTIAARRGYQLSKRLMESRSSLCRVLYVDEIGRFSRDVIEALNLGRLIESSGKRMVGAADGFDSDTPFSKQQLTLFAMFHEMFVEQLRAKVYRGMKDAFAKGKNIRPPSVGYKLVPMLNDNGTPMVNSNGRLVSEKVIDDATASHVEEAFRMFADEKQSPQKITRRFNDLRVKGRDTWNDTCILQLLSRSTYIGIEFDNMTRWKHDPVTGAVTVIDLPQEEWQRREVPHLRIIPDELFARAQQRKKECSKAFAPIEAKRAAKREMNRTEVYPTLLIRPDCADCQQPLVLGRTGKYASFFCLNGRNHSKGCRLRTYKSVKLFEDKILGFVRQHVLTKEVIETALAEANRCLVEQARRPRQDTRPILAELKRMKSLRDRLAELFDRESDEGLDALVAKLRQHERRIKELQQQLKEAEVRESAPQAMTPVDVEAMLQDLHGLLTEDVALSAPILAKLTGPIEVRDGETSGRKIKPWIARFRPNIAAFIAEAGQRVDQENQTAWQFVAQQPEQSSDFVEIVIDEVPQYELLAPEFQKLRDQGNGTDTIASAYGLTWSRVAEILHFADTGERPKTKPKKDSSKPSRPRAPQGSYKLVAPLVAQMRDEKEMEFEEIKPELKKLGWDVGMPTIRRAYDFSHREEFLEAVAQGRKPNRGRRSGIGYEKQEQIKQLLLEDRLEVKQIANHVGCGVSTVRRTQKRMKAQASNPKPQRRSA